MDEHFVGIYCYHVLSHPFLSQLYTLIGDQMAARLPFIKVKLYEKFALSLSISSHQIHNPEYSSFFSLSISCP